MFIHTAIILWLFSKYCASTTVDLSMNDMLNFSVYIKGGSLCRICGRLHRCSEILTSSLFMSAHCCTLCRHVKILIDLRVN